MYTIANWQNKLTSFGLVDFELKGFIISSNIKNLFETV